MSLRSSMQASSKENPSVQAIFGGRETNSRSSTGAPTHAHVNTHTHTSTQPHTNAHAHAHARTHTEAKPDADTRYIAAMARPSKTQAKVR